MYWQWYTCYKTQKVQEDYSKANPKWLTGGWTSSNDSHSGWSSCVGPTQTFGSHIGHNTASSSGSRSRSRLSTHACARAWPFQGWASQSPWGQAQWERIHWCIVLSIKIYLEWPLNNLRVQPGTPRTVLRCLDDVSRAEHCCANTKSLVDWSVRVSDLPEDMCDWSEPWIQGLGLDDGIGLGWWDWAWIKRKTISPVTSKRPTRGNSRCWCFGHHLVLSLPDTIVSLQGVSRRCIHILTINYVEIQVKKTLDTPKK